MRYVSMIATLAISAFTQAHAQEGSWGDGVAAHYNVPMGYGSQAEFHGVPKEPKRDGKLKKKPAPILAARTCIYGVDGVTPDDGARAGADEAPEFPQRPCMGRGGPTPDQMKRITNDPLTGVKTGAWTTVLVESKRQTNINQPATLNGGLNLD